MTKWKRLRKLKERKRTEVEALDPKAELDVKPVEQINLGDPRKIKKPESTSSFNPNPILAQIPRYVYLIAFFSLLSGIFFPLITPGISIFHVILGIAVLFLGLVGGILLFKGATADNIRIGLIITGLTLIAISLALIFVLREQTSVDLLIS